MICLKNKLTLFLLAFIATLQVGLVFRTERLIRMVQDFEPVIIQYAEDYEPETEAIPPRIICPLDAETQQMIADKCEEYGIDFAFTMAVIFKESSFNPNADSGSSVGLMQINRINHEWLSEELGITDFFDPEQNVTAGLHMLRELFDKYEDCEFVLMAYNMGETGARNLWNRGIYTSDYAEGVLQQAEIYNEEIQERMGENDQV